MTRITCFAACAAALAACSSTTPCKTVRDCANTQLCVTGGCAELTTGASAIGDACRTATDCKSGLDCFTADQGFPGGYCTAACSAAGPSCAAGTCTDVGSSAICAAQCTDDSTCRQGYGCCAALGAVCVPFGGCNSGQCLRPVQPSSFASRTASDASPLAGPVSIPLGSHVVDETLSFAVPAGTGSLSIVHQAEIANLLVVYQGQVIDNSAVPLKLFFPDGGVAYDDIPSTQIVSSPDGGTEYFNTYAFFSNYAPSTGVFTVPNTTKSLDAGVPAGTWSFKVNDFANECARYISGCTDGGSTTNTYNMGVLLRPLPAGTNLNVDFYIVADMTTRTGQPFNAQNAATDQDVQRMVQTFTGILAQNGAAITASVHFRDVDASSRALYGTSIDATTTGPCDPLDQMFLLSGVLPDGGSPNLTNSVNIFLVNGLRSADTGGGNTIVGIDGTIPGPASINGTVHSGAVVSAADLFKATAQNCPANAMSLGGCGPDRVAYIAAHETGHYLGLFHTTEQNGADFDTLSDTGKCACIPCAGAQQSSCTSSNPPLLSATQCGSTTCQGGDNLMFWLLDGAVSQGKITAQQSQVMRLNPAVE